MRSPRDRFRDQNRTMRAYTASVILGSAACFVIALVSIGTDAIGELFQRSDLYLILALVVLADTYPFLPWMRDVRNRVRLHLSGAFTLALLLVCGPAAIVLFPVISAVAQARITTALWRRVFNGAVLTLEAVLGYTALWLAMGSWPAEPTAGQLLVGGTIVAVVWEVVNVLAVCTAMTLIDSSQFWDNVRLGAKRTVPWLTALVAAPLIAYGLVHAAILIPSLGLITILGHHAITSTIRASDDARTDRLTGLANRAALMELLDDVFRPNSPVAEVAVLMIDLNEFKTINDKLGHVAGDAVLAEVGRRLRRSSSGSLITARLGGDEFVVVVADVAAAPLLADRIRDALSEPLPDALVPQGSWSIGASIGIAASHAGDSPLDLLRAADRQMYQDKADRADASASSER